MKLWQKENTKIVGEVEAFTIGDDALYDIELAPYDILGSFAHSLMLNKIGILNKKEIALLSKAFKKLYTQSLNQQIKIDPNIEDIHSQIEFLLTKELGTLGKKIHTGRSRNDQVLLDLKLYARFETQVIVGLVKSLFDVLIQQSDKHKKVLMPGYTHFQVAMPSSFGLWFGAYAESLAEDLYMIQGAYRLCNQNPLGSGAGFGSSFPLDRQYTTTLLGFEDLNYNVVHAQMTRGKFEKNLLQSFSSLSQTLNKMAMDVCLYVNDNYRFINLPKEFTTGSSIMPHKKNPDPFELIRAHTNKLSALSNEISLLVHNLPSGYHRDFQLIKPTLINGIKSIKQILKMTILLSKNITPNLDILQDPKYDYLFTVEEVNKLVLNGMPFRDAYQQVGNIVEQNKFIPNKKIHHTHEGSIGNLCNKNIARKMTDILKTFNFTLTNKAIQQLINKMQ